MYQQPQATHLAMPPGCALIASAVGITLVAAENLHPLEDICSAPSAPFRAARPSGSTASLSSGTCLSASSNWPPSAESANEWDLESEQQGVGWVGGRGSAAEQQAHHGGPAATPAQPVEADEDEDGPLVKELVDGEDGSGDDTYLAVGPASATEVVFVRERVAVCPDRTQRIPGRLSLIRQHCVLFLTWLPYSPGHLERDGSFSMPATATHPERSAYALHPLPFSDIKSVRQHTPRFGGQSIAVTLHTGVTLPPLHFPDRAGLAATMAAFCQHARLVRSLADPQLLLVNDVADPLSRSLHALDLADVLLGGAPANHAPATFHPAAAGLAPALSPQPPPVGRAAASGAGRGRLGTAGGRPAVARGAVEAEAEAGGADGATRSDHMAAAGASAAHSVAPHMSRSSYLPGAAQSGSPRGCGPTSGGAGRKLGAPWLHMSHTVSYTLQGLSQLVADMSRELAGVSSDSNTEDGDTTGKGEVGGEAGTTSWLAARLHSPALLTFNTAAAALPDAPYLLGSAEPPNPASAAPAPPPPAAVPGSLKLPPPTPASRGSSLHALAGPGAAAGLDGGPGVLPALASPPTGAGGGPQGGGAAAERLGLCEDDAGYEMVEAVGLHLAPGAAGEASRRQAAGGLPRPTPPPLSLDEWHAMHDAAGRLVGEPLLRQRAWSSGLDPAVRREAWAVLLGLTPAGSTRKEQAAAMLDRRKQYHALRVQWQSISKAQAAHFSHWRERRVRVEKDVWRTDRQHPFFADAEGAALKALRRLLLTYSIYHFDRGYCQGMSDCAAPLLVVLRDESEAFWAFVSLMDAQGMGANFDVDQQGMHAQLSALRSLMQLLDPQLHAHLDACDCLSFFHAFRWLLVRFKRELKFKEVLRLWEAQWACPHTRHLHLYLACAILVHHRRAIMQQVTGFDDMLKFALSLAGNLQLEPLLQLADTLCYYAGEAGKEVLQALPARVSGAQDAPVTDVAGAGSSTL